MHHWMGRAGTASGVYVYDVTSGTPLFALRADVGRAPASVEKLYTSVALLDEPRTRTLACTRSVLGAGSLGPGGVWHGDLYLRGGGDPTLAHAPSTVYLGAGYGSTLSRARRAADGGAASASVTGVVIGDPSLFDDRRSAVRPPATAADTPDLGGELSALTYNHGAAGGSRPRRSRPARAWRCRCAPRMCSDARPADGDRRGATRRAHARGGPVATAVDLLRLMDVPSDDLYAEMLTKELGARFGGAGSTTAGAKVIATGARRLRRAPDGRRRLGALPRRPLLAARGRDPARGPGRRLRSAPCSRRRSRSPA